MNILNVKNRFEFRLWLESNSLKENECFIIVKKGRPVDTNIFYYLDAVEEALCFGWIDSTHTIIDGIRYQRFSPRAKNSPWSELNKERVRRLIKLCLMKECGLKILPDLNLRHFKFDIDIINSLKKERLWTRFKSYPFLYQRIRAYNITFYKTRNKEMYFKALNHLIEETKKNKMYGEWNDYGRLLDY